jgi:RHS repeat-associated protein
MEPVSLYAGGGGQSSGGGSGSGSGSGSASKPSLGQRFVNWCKRVGQGIKDACTVIGTAITKGPAAAVLKSAELKAAREARKQGDPVLVTSGQYQLTEEDAAVPGSGFVISREYLSGETVVGSFGRGWATALDSRIIRGKTVVPAEELKAIKGEVGKIQTLAEDITKAGETVGNALAEEGETGEVGKPILDTGVLDGFENLESVINEEDGELYDRNEILKELGELTPEQFERGREEVKDEIAGIQKEASAKYEELKAIDDEAKALSALNGQVLYAGSPGDYENLGNGNLLLITETGSPVAFEAAGTGAWTACDETSKLTMKLTSRDGKGADTQAGFILTERGGIKKYYGGNGLLEAVETLNGNRVELIRTNGRVTRIQGPHGNEWKLSYNGTSGLLEKLEDPLGRVVTYAYSGNFLTHVKDADGDIVQYVYEDGRLARIAKADGRSITLTYGVERNGEKMVTATTHEEGGTERFDYFSEYTVYTNHSGVVTKHWYNRSHQMTREEYADGTIKTYAYANSGLLANETVNGFETKYSYDSRGNITKKEYGDGTREEWSWNANDLETRHISRDGVVTEKSYDAQGNCVSIRKGGETVFSGVYGQKGMLLESRTGTHTPVRYSYDSRDFPVSKTFELNGQSITERYEYDQLGRLCGYVDGEGREWRYEYGKRIQKTVGPQGLEITYVYNNRKDLVNVIEKDAVTGETREKTITYDKRHLPILEKDGAGNETGYTYRDDGLMTKKETGPWYWTYEYDGAGRLSKVIRDKKGATETYTEYYGYGRQGWETERVISIPGAGVTTYRYNVWDQITGVTNALGETSTRTLNGAGNVTQEQGANGGFYSFRYDGAGRLIEVGREGEEAVRVRYNTDGAIMEKTDRFGKVTRYEYDGRGLASRETSGLGEKRYYYDNAGRLIRQETVSANNGTVYTSEWAYNNGARTVTASGGGKYTETFYLDAWENVVKRVDGEGNEQHWCYNGAGQVVKAIDGYGNETTYAWNELGKVARIAGPDGAVTEYEYNHLGKTAVIKNIAGVMWEGTYDEAGRLAAEKGWPGINKTYRYDAVGRVIEVRSGGDMVERYRYGSRGREIEYQDGKGASFIQRKNAFGELNEEVNRIDDIQRFGYDKEGRQVETTAYSGKQTRVEYRDDDDVTVTLYSDGTRSVIEKDLAGNIIRVENGNGTIRYRYDTGNKLIEQVDEGAGETTRYEYDRAGRRTRMASGNRDVRYGYGKNGELLWVRDAGQGLEARYEYDTAGKETRRTYGNGVKQETFYDRAGRTVLITETGATRQLVRSEGYVYDDEGRRSHSVDEDGKVTKYEYDKQSRLKTVLYPWTEEKAQEDKKEAEEAGLYFTPDKGSGERYTLTGSEVTALRTVLNLAGPMRGNAVSGSQLIWRESYTYDRNGNRTEKKTPWGTIRYAYDAENRLLTKGDIVYVNDKDGNVLTEKGLRYEAEYRYNGQGRMAYSAVTSHVEKTFLVSFYGYDALGRRMVTEDLGGQAMRVLYDGKSFEAIREGVTFSDGSFTTRGATVQTGVQSGTTQSNAPTGERYRWISDGEQGRASRLNESGYRTTGNRFTGTGVTLYGKGEAIGANLSASGGNRVYLGKDIQGSVRSRTGEVGSLEDRYEYDAFGKPYKGDLSKGMNLGYTGKPYDGATGLYNYGYRDYKPETVRFTTPDPVRDGNNWYAYVNNDPVNWVDPVGLSASDKKGADLNLNASGTKEYYYAEYVARPEDTFVVVAHGSPDDMSDWRSGTGKEITPQDLAAEIKNHPNYTEGMSVTLYSCSTGQAPLGGGDSYGQQVADAMGPGSTVNAPDKMLWTYYSGKTPTISDEKANGWPDKKNPGQWVTFTGVQPQGGAP